MEEYDKFIIRMNTPRVVVDNAVCATATVVKVDSARERGVLLEALRVLADLDLVIGKAYISSDGRWFMNVFHVTDRHGRKLADCPLASKLELSLCADAEDNGNDVPVEVAGGEMCGATELALAGDDRPGLLSEIFAVLRDAECDVVAAKVWTHNGRVACLISVVFGSANDPHRIVARLRSVLIGDDGERVTAGVGPPSTAHSDRRMHQLMFDDRNYERAGCRVKTPLVVSVQNWVDRGYSVVNVECRDRTKLLFDVVCTLIDMEYVVFHGTVDTDGIRARQAFGRHSDQFGSRAAASGSMSPSRHRAQSIRGSDARAADGGSQGLTGGRDANPTRARTVGDEGRSYHQSRSSHELVLRRRPVRPRHKPEDRRRHHGESQRRQPQVERRARSVLASQVFAGRGGDSGERRRRNRTLPPGQHRDEEPLQLGTD